MNAMNKEMTLRNRFILTSRPCSFVLISPLFCCTTSLLAWTANLRELPLSRT